MRSHVPLGSFHFNALVLLAFPKDLRSSAKLCFGASSLIVSPALLWVTNGSCGFQCE
jgi:hypothetical protein